MQREQDKKLYHSGSSGRLGAFGAIIPIHLRGANISPNPFTVLDGISTGHWLHTIHCLPKTPICR